MKKKLTLLLFYYILAQNLFSQNTLIVGTESNFNNFLLKNLTIVNSIGGKDYLQLLDNEYIETPYTETLFHFNNQDFKDEVNNYTIENSYNNITFKDTKFGEGALFFLKNRPLTFTSTRETIFSPDRLLGDFTIEFWAKPTVINEDSTIFLWKGVNKVEQEFIQQKIKFYFEGRHGVWEFDNFFIPSDFSKYSIKLKSRSKILPNQWNHYLIRYNSTLGLLEFLINDTPEDIKYTTETFKENMNTYTPYVGNFSINSFEMGTKFNGFLDEFRVTSSFIEKAAKSNYLNSGTFYTPVIEIKDEVVDITNISTNEISNPETEIIYSYRVSNDPFTQNNSSLEWKLLKKFNDTKGRYIQVMGDIYSDGSNKLSPLFNNIEIEWLELTKPPAPQFLATSSNKNSITVSWNSVKHYNIDGYYLYFGPEKNNYTEMIDVGKNTSYTINNLISNKSYYFSVRSYSDTLLSEYSAEKFNRPE